MKKSEEGEPISRHMGFPPSISSNYNYPPHTTGKEQETTKMTNTEATSTKRKDLMSDNINDRFKITYHYILSDGELSTEANIEPLLFTIPNLLKDLAENDAKVIITSIEQITGGEA